MQIVFKQIYFNKLILQQKESEILGNHKYSIINEANEEDEVVYEKNFNQNDEVININFKSSPSKTNVKSKLMKGGSGSGSYKTNGG